MANKIFVDMDGTVARFFKDAKCLEKMYDRGFFFNLKPYKKAIKLVNKLCEDITNEVYILSACVKSPYCKDEKNAWLDANLPIIDKAHRILVGTGVNKAQYVKDNILDANYKNRVTLIDDYSVNLAQWKEVFDKQGVALKAVNEINNKHNRVFDGIVKVNR